MGVALAFLFVFALSLNSNHVLECDLSIQFCEGEQMEQTWWSLDTTARQNFWNGVSVVSRT